MTEHEKDIQEMATEHFDLMRLVDKIKIIDALKHALDDPDKTIKDLVELNYEARVSAFKLGRPDAEKIN